MIESASLRHQSSTPVFIGKQLPELENLHDDTKFKINVRDSPQFLVHSPVPERQNHKKSAGGTARDSGVRFTHFWRD
jgi:hypothetical protein